MVAKYTISKEKILKMYLIRKLENHFAETIFVACYEIYIFHNYK